MTKKDYEAVAAELRSISEEPAFHPDNTVEYQAGFHTAIHAVTERLADVFEADNPRFDRERFRNAAKPKGMSIYVSRN